MSKLIYLRTLVYDDSIKLYAKLQNEMTETSKVINYEYQRCLHLFITKERPTSKL